MRRRHTRAVVRVSAGLIGLCGIMGAQAAPIRVLHPQGSAHGFVDITDADGTRLGVGDLEQRLHNDVVSSRLVLHFFDGSLDDETTVYSERGVFRLLSDHHVQRGPKFPQPLDATVDARKGEVTSIDEHGKVTTVHVDMPGDVYNGMASTLLMNVDPATPETKIAIVIAGAKPRIVHLSMKPAGEQPFQLGGTERKATDFVVHVEIGGIAGVIAPLVGKEPIDYHVWLVTGPDPAFIRMEGQLYVGGPVWRLQQISPTFQ